MYKISNFDYLHFEEIKTNITSTLAIENQKKNFHLNKLKLIANKHHRLTEKVIMLNCISTLILKCFNSGSVNFMVLTIDLTLIVVNIAILVY